MSLTVVYAPESRHVLGAVRQTGAAGTASGVADLVGPALPLWVAQDDTTVTDLAVPAARLAVAVVDDELGALAAPLNFGVEIQPGGTVKSALRGLNSWTASGGERITLAPDGVTVTLPGPAPAATAVLVLVAGARSTPLLSGEIPAGQAAVKIGTALTAGRYGVLALVDGWEGLLQPVALP